MSSQLGTKIRNIICDYTASISIHNKVFDQTPTPFSVAPEDKKNVSIGDKEAKFPTLDHIINGTPTSLPDTTMPIPSPDKHNPELAKHEFLFQEIADLHDAIKRKTKKIIEYEADLLSKHDKSKSGVAKTSPMVNEILNPTPTSLSRQVESGNNISDILHDIYDSEDDGYSADEHDIDVLNDEEYMENDDYIDIIDDFGLDPINPTKKRTTENVI